MARKHNHYFRPCPYDSIDVYRIIEIFEITDPAAQHILKKCIATGKRGHKDERRDWEDIVDSAQRKIEMLEEDSEVAKGNEPTFKLPIDGVVAQDLLARGSETFSVGGTPHVNVTPQFSHIPLYNRRAEDKGQK